VSRGRSNAVKGGALTRLAKIRVGECTVCAELNLIERGDESIRIEPRAMDVLMLLAQRAGTVVSVNEIMEVVWSGVVVGDGSVYLAIRQLRQALGRTADGGGYIETIPKRGYRLTADVRPAEADVESPAEAVHNARPSRSLAYLGIAAVALVVVAAAGWAFLKPLAPPAEAPETVPRLAVLPFVNDSVESDHEAFVDGLAGVLRDRLTRLGELEVAGSAPSRRFKDSDQSLAAIGAELGVRHVLEGSVRRQGDALRVSVRLTDVDSGLQRWSEQYEGTLAQIFSFEDEITSSVAEALEITLGVGERGQVPGMTRDYNAYAEFVKGLGIDVESETDLIPRAIQHLRRAVEIDPTFTYGWLILSHAYYHGALRLPDMAEEWLRQLSFEEGGHMGPETYLLLATYFLCTGRTAEAVRSLERWRAIAPPEDVAGYFYFGVAYERTGDFDAALAAYDLALERMSDAVILHGGALLTALAKRDLEEIRRRAEFFESAPRGAFNVRMTQLLEDPKAALAEIQELAASVRMHDTLGLSAMNNWAAYYGDPRHAVALLHRMDRSGLNGIVLLFDMWRPTLAAARRLPEFKELVRDLGLVEYWRAYGWSDHCRPVGENDFECE
jgi:DNA-binding winged helix-turn-helix (wHTH) protein/TolB-like protein/tetratricopeptide (TPR) repeat protein